MTAFITGLITAISGNTASPDGWVFYILLPLLIIPAAILYFFKRKNPDMPKYNGSILSGFKELFSGASLQSAKRSELGQLIYDAGYAYDAKQDIFYSHMDAWQRKFGYCRLYDEMAPHLSMVFDSEPVYFQYDKKRWMIEFWKGQYGMTTGCEAGVYVTDKEDIDIPGVFKGAFYDCVKDADRLQMSATLSKNKKVLFKRTAKHWWLTGFVLGEFSDPSELKMNLGITLKNSAMRKEYVKGLKQAGYKAKEIKVKGNTVSVVFGKPHTKQPYTRGGETEAEAQRDNKYYCDRYRELTKGSKDTPSKIEALRKNNPELFRLLLNLRKSQDLFSIYGALKGN